MKFYHMIALMVVGVSVSLVGTSFIPVVAEETTKEKIETKTDDVTRKTKKEYRKAKKKVRDATGNSSLKEDIKDGAKKIKRKVD